MLVDDFAPPLHLLREPWRPQFVLMGTAVVARRVTVAVAVVAMVIGLALVSRDPRDGDVLRAKPAIHLGWLGKHKA